MKSTFNYPELIDESSDAGRRRLDVLKQENVEFLDFSVGQVEELAKIRMTAPSELNKTTVWVYYPWLRKALKILEKDKFVEVRSGRNRYKITDEEQTLLASKKIGVVGLSVGRTISTTLAQERSCGELRLADFDKLELSNLNRIKAPLHHIGLAKTESTFREIKEMDPFFEVRCFEHGLTEENLHAFFTEQGKLDIVVDECDSLEMKIKLRKKARELGVPVLMDTSDRGMIDVERFDLEQKRPYFHGKIGEMDPPYTWKMTQEERQQLFVQIIDIEKVSERGKYSLSEIGKTISSWPQLASDVVTGGGVTAQLCRKILLEEKVESGRYYFDVDLLLNEGKGR